MRSDREAAVAVLVDETAERDRRVVGEALRRETRFRRRAFRDDVRGGRGRRGAGPRGTKLPRRRRRGSRRRGRRSTADAEVARAEGTRRENARDAPRRRRRRRRPGERGRGGGPVFATGSRRARGFDVRLDRRERVRGSTRRLERPADATEGSVGARAGHRGRGGSGASRGVRAGGRGGDGPTRAPPRRSRSRVAGQRVVRGSFPGGGPGQRRAGSSGRRPSTSVG